MDRTSADAALSSVPELVPFGEASVAQAREMERKLLDGDIPVALARPPAKACCAGGCGCGAKVQLLVREEDLPKVTQLLHSEWLEAVRKEGTLTPELLVQLQVPAGEGEPPCPACTFVGPLNDGACSDCGLQLE
jgi:hypothetical protein